VLSKQPWWWKQTPYEEILQHIPKYFQEKYNIMFIKIWVHLSNKWKGNVTLHLSNPIVHKQGSGQGLSSPDVDVRLQEHLNIPLITRVANTFLNAKLEQSTTPRCRDTKDATIRSTILPGVFCLPLTCCEFHMPMKSNWFKCFLLSF
jgi:hypothetical protein